MTGPSMLPAILLVLLLVLYFLPAIIAHRNRHQHAVAVTVLNLFLGWTGLGWVIALVWACMAIQSGR